MSAARARVWTALALATLLAPACMPHGEFRCRSDQACGATGTCESTGFCSFSHPGDTCPSGRRYGTYAPESLADQCVADVCPSDPVRAVRAGASHACAIRASGALACWGRNDDGQLGDGTSLSRPRMTPALGLGPVLDVALGDRHTCAILKADGTVWCWGANESGQLGDGTTAAHERPAPVPELAGASTLAAGGASTCAVRADQTVSCWGRNADGELGLGNAGAPVTTPTVVPLLDGVVTLGARNQHACAVTGDGLLYCWGSSTQGELGDGRQVPHPNPTLVVGLADNTITAVTMGVAHTCALGGGQVWCWGTNQLGELGDGSGTTRGVPGPVALLTSVVDIAAGVHHTCAVESTGQAWCWGANDDGQLGEGTTGSFGVPVPSTSVEHAVEVTAGDQFSCARLRDGSLRCWGDDRDGQLGIGSERQRLSPARVTNLTTALSVSAGGASACARQPTAGAAIAMCWGANQAGQLGDGTRIDRPTPTALKIGLDTAEVAVGGAHACLRAGTGGVWCWGRGGSGQLGTTALIDFVVPVAVAGLTGTSALAAGDKHTCAVLGAGVTCWGANDDGQLGDGSNTSRSTPVAIPGLSGVVELALGGAHSCARRADGSIVCWGRGGDGQLGDGLATSSGSPVAPGDLTTTGALTGVVALAAGDRHTCAALADGTAVCWGAGDAGQLGWGTPEGHARPVKVMALDRVVSLAAGREHTCARVASTGGAASAPGSVYCWGDNSAGQLGDGTRTSRLSPDPLAPVLEDALALAAGAAHTCALRSDHSIACWGDGGDGQLGTGIALAYPTAQPTLLACP